MGGGGPDDLNELRNIYCAVLAGKQALIVADDGQDAAPVRPLLPPHGCALLVTSRNRIQPAGDVAGRSAGRAIHARIGA